MSSFSAGQNSFWKFLFSSLSVFLNFLDSRLISWVSAATSKEMRYAHENVAILLALARIKLALVLYQGSRKHLQIIQIFSRGLPVIRSFDISVSDNSTKMKPSYQLPRESGLVAAQCAIHFRCHLYQKPS